MGLVHCSIVVRTCVLAILKTQSCHLSLYILNHFFALNTSGHNEITALLLDIVDGVLLQIDTIYKTILVL